MCSPAKHPPIGRILFVDKDLDMLDMMKMVLMPKFQLVTASSAEQGLALMESEAPFDIIISGFTLVLMNGLEFLCQAGEICPQTARILMSGGCGDDAEINLAISEGHINRLVLKPFCVSTIREQLKSDLASIRSGDACRSMTC